MTETIFYSWQSDVPYNRNFIEKALEQAIKELNREEVLRVDACIDRALKGAAGAVRIDRDIFARIDACEIFVGDVSLVTAKDFEGRPSPNPCVLIELGYAVKQLDWNRVILPFNSATGLKEWLPFDLEKNRLAIFHLDLGADEATRAKVKADLVATFKAAIKAILAAPTIKSKIAQFFNETNAAILEQVRSGRARLSVNIAGHRIATLEDLQKQRGCDEYIEVQRNGNWLGDESCSNGGINDHGGPLLGFHVTFKGDPHSW